MKGLDLPSPKCVILLGAAQFSPVLSRRRGCHQCLPQDSRYQVSTAARYLCLFHRAPINHIVMPYFWSKHDIIAALRRRRGASGSRNGRSEGQVIGVSSEGPDKSHCHAIFFGQNTILSPRRNNIYSSSAPWRQQRRRLLAARSPICGCSTLAPVDRSGARGRESTLPQRASARLG